MPSAPQARPSALMCWIAASRPKTLTAAVAPVAVGTVLAWASGGLKPVAALLCLAFALLVQIATNFANDYFDFIKGADAERKIGPARMCASGLIKPEDMRAATVAVLILAFLTGCGLIPFGGWWLVGVGVASLVSAVAYTGGPYPLGYNGWGDVFVILFFGLVAVMVTFYVQTGRFTTEAAVLGLGCGIVINNLLVVNNYRDRDTDKAAGKMTLIARFGKGFGFWQLVLGYLAGPVSLACVLLMNGILLTPRSLIVLAVTTLFIFAQPSPWQLKTASGAEDFSKQLQKASTFVMVYALGTILCLMPSACKPA